MTKQKAFTLVELIIVIAIIAILAGAIFVAIDPARRLHESRNARRHSDVSTILDAIKKYQVDNEGVHFEEIADADQDTYYVIGDSGGLCTPCTKASPIEECIDFTDFPSNYLAVIPEDPKVGTLGDTKYYIRNGSDGAFTVGACEPEGEGPGGTGTAPTIELTR